MEITKTEARYLLRLIGEDMVRMDGMTVADAKKRAASCLHVQTDALVGPSIEALQFMARGLAARLHGIAPEGV